MKWYQGDVYTTGCLLDYNYIKNPYRSITVDLSRQKELEADSKAIQQVEFVRQLKKKCRWYKCGWNTKSVYFKDFRRNQINEIKIFSS